MAAPQVKTHLPSIFQLLMGLIGLISGLAAVVVLAGIVLFGGSVLPMDSFARNQALSLVWACLALALLTLPSVVLSIRRLAHKPPSAPLIQNRFLAASLALIPVAGLGYLGSRLAASQGNSIILSLISILLVLSPIWWFVEFGREKLPTGSGQWQWGLVGFAINVTLPIILLIELALIVVLIVAGGAWLSQQPEFTPFWMQVQTQMMLDPQELTLLTERLLPLLQKPAFVVWGFLFVSMFVPLIEEALKPLALWFFMKRGMTGIEGFTAGLLCGAGFALVESITSILAVPGEAWGFTIIGRVGTGLLHIFTAGIMGWALCASWQDGKYTRSGVVFLVNVLVHGVWNFLAVSSALTDRLPVTLNLFPGLPVWVSPAAMVAIFVLLFTGLWIMNRYLRHQLIPPVIPPMIPPLRGQSVE